MRIGARIIFFMIVQGQNFYVRSEESYAMSSEHKNEGICLASPGNEYCVLVGSSQEAVWYDLMLLFVIV